MSAPDTVVEASAAPSVDVDLLVVDGLTAHFDLGGDPRTVLEDVSFSARTGCITAIVGETGSGKSLTALSVLGLQPSGLIRTAGDIRFRGDSLLTMSADELRRIRGGQIAIVFQDAKAALNPVVTVGTQLSDTAQLHRGLSKRQARAVAVEQLRAVQIPEPERRMRQYPHEFSGGMAQRVMLAMALVCEPDLLILDEPTTGLDVTIQADVMELIVELCRRRRLTGLLITHDLGVVAELAEHVVVMHGGRVVETGSAEEIFLRPRQPYTRKLLAASRLDRKR